MLDQRRRKHAADLDIVDNSHPASSNSLQRQRHALSHKVKVQAAQFECNAPQMIHEVSWLVPRCALAAGSTHSSLRRPNPVLRSSLVVSQIGVSQIGGLSDAKAFLTARVRQICVRQIRLSDAWPADADPWPDRLWFVRAPTVSLTVPDVSVHVRESL